jgi:hypothetical protein
MIPRSTLVTLEVLLATRTAARERHQAATDATVKTRMKEQVKAAEHKYTAAKDAALLAEREMRQKQGVRPMFVSSHSSCNADRGSITRTPHTFPSTRSQIAAATLEGRRMEAARANHHKFLEAAENDVEKAVKLAYTASLFGGKGA